MSRTAEPAKNPNLDLLFPLHSSGTVGRVLLVLLLYLFLFPGCAQWSKDQTVSEPSPLLAKPKKGPDSVLVETVLVRFPKAKLPEFQQMWSEIDETFLPMETRERLDQNGIRVGLVISELPKAIRDQIAETSHDQNTDALEHAGLAADSDNMTRRLQCRAGRRKELFVRNHLSEPLTVLTVIDSATQGQTFEKANALFDLRAIPHGDKQTTVELTPEVQHGELKHSYVTSEIGMRPELRRASENWQDLKIVTKLNLGQVLVVTASQPTKALGKAFFTTKTADQSEEYTILLLRVVETQLDELFDPDSVAQAQALAER